MTPAPLLILVSHGNLGAAALESASLIFGPIEGAAAIGLPPSGRLEDLERQVHAARREFGPDRPVILLVDLFGGSCSNVATKLLKSPIEGQAPLRVVAGFNLAMLIEFAFSRGKYDLDQLADRMIEAGKKACLDVNARARGIGR